MTVAADPSQAPDRPYRVFLDRLRPEIDGGHCAIKRMVGDSLVAEVDLLADGHDRVDGVLLCRRAGESTWRETPLVSQGGDRWRGECVLHSLGRWQDTVEGWVDAFAIDPNVMPAHIFAIRRRVRSERSFEYYL